MVNDQVTNEQSHCITEAKISVKGFSLTMEMIIEGVIGNKIVNKHPLALRYAVAYQ
jgi:hypothetical protein